MEDMIMSLARNVSTNDNPLTPQEISKITQVVAKNSDDCSICYMKIFPKAMILRLPCPHMYHIKCISAWLQKNPHCPMCRKHALSHKWNDASYLYLIE